MEFRFDVEHLLPNEITRVDNNLIVPEWKTKTRNRVEYQELYQIVNAIGEASSFAQGLNNIITTSEKLQNSNHLLYLMKEVDESSGITLVVGMLKVGRKKLFLLDHDQRTRESAPLCVLDFYIHESRQRRGYGRRLFDHMLRDQDVLPGHMAVDKPSDKFMAFLHKHYNLYKQVPQINNFVIYDTFFHDRPITTEEASLVQVYRSPRNISPPREYSRSSQPSSPLGSHNSSRRSSGGSVQAHSAGLPTTQRLNNDMTDILHGRPDRHTPSVRLCPRYQTTLEWMRGTASGGESPYSRTPTSYSASRTPSNTGSPLRTPWGGSPPRTPPAVVSHTSRKDSRDIVDAQSLEGSIAPTPATSPDRSTAKGAENGEKDDDGSVIDQQPGGDEDGIDEKLEKLKLTSGQQSPGKGNQWSTSVARSSASLAERMSTPGSSTMSGVLNENDSVHGHLKFHHHALW